MKTIQLDTFTQAYIECALWSSTEYKFGVCPCCGANALLSHYPEPEFAQDAMCAAPGCGVREIPNPDPMDKNYSAADLAPETVEKIRKDCERFQNENADVLSGADYDCRDYCNEEMAGHDFWLTRNGHGAGFWDRDVLDESVRDALTKASKKFGEANLYAGDDGKLYQTP